MQELLLMIDQLLTAIRYMAGKGVAGRSLRTYADDTFIVSYPKSGNTWTRFLVANLVYGDEPVTFLNIDRLIPMADNQSRKYFRKMARPRIIKSHYPFDPAYKRVIYIVRDPRDVAVSQYHYQLKRQVLTEHSPIDDFVHRFVLGETCPYGSWGENVSSWVAARSDSPNFLLLRYEDMIAQPCIEVAKLASFFKLKATSELIMNAVEQSSAGHLRKLEKLQADRWDSTKGTRADIAFVREAACGGWKLSLPGGCVAEIEAAWAPLMRWLKYDPTVITEAASDRIHELLPQGYMQ
jgi:hypothetical protein